MPSWILLLLLAGFGATSVDAATCTTVGSGNWNSAAIWQDEIVPGLGDDVVIAAGCEVSFDPFFITPQFGKVTVRGALTLSQASALLAQNIAVESTGRIFLQGGSMNVAGGNGGNVVEGAMDFLNGASVQVVGNFQVTASASIKLGQGATLRLVNSDAVNSGEINCGIGSTLSVSGSLNNIGKIDCLAGSTLSVSGNFENPGKIDCAAGSTFSLSGVLKNDGTVDQKGRVVPNGTGQYTIYNGGLWKIYSEPLGTTAGQGSFHNLATLQTFGSPSIFYATLENFNGTIQIQGSRVETFGGSICQPVIHAGPSNQIVLPGETVTFTVVSSFATFFLWTHGEGEGFETSTGSLRLSNVSPADAGIYTVTAFNMAGGQLLSSQPFSVTLTVTALAPRISEQPANRTVFVGESATFHVSATGEPPLSYQWLKDGQPIAGQTGPAATITATSVASGGNYSVIVSNPHASITSSSAVLTVNPPPTIVTPPAHLAVYENQSAHFAVAASGLSLSYQWLKNSTPIAGATSASYDIAMAALNSEADYSVIVINPSGSITSPSAHLTIRPPSYIEGIVGQLTARVGSPAQQGNLVALQNSVNSLLDVNVGSLASQNSVNAIQAKLDTLALPSAAHPNLDTNVASRASQASLDNLAANSLPALNNNILTRASQTSVDTANGKLDALQSSANVLSNKLDSAQTANQASLAAATSKLDAAVSSRASQGSLDDLATNSLPTLNSNILARASQTSVDAATAAIAAANGKLDSLGTSVATKTLVDSSFAGVNTKLDTLGGSLSTANGKLDSLAGSTASLATQSALTALQNGVNTKLTTAQTSLDGLHTSATAIAGKIDALAASQAGVDGAAARLDVTVSSRASQTSLDDLKTNLLATLSSNTLTRASQSSLDGVTAAVAAANSKLAVGLDTNLLSRASQASVDSVVTGLNNANGKLDAAVSSRASQTSLDTANGSLATANAALGTANNSLATLDGKLNARLDATISSRATQASVDGVTARVNFGLDTNLLSRASEVMLNNVRTNLDAGIDLITRVGIERQLADASAPRITIFFIPAAQGGLLEFVRDIVTNCIQMSQAAGVPSGKAGNFLATANAAYGNQQYKTAYDNYAQAYQAISK